jgi:hypothetical protein
VAPCYGIPYSRCSAICSNQITKFDHRFILLVSFPCAIVLIDSQTSPRDFFFNTGANTILVRKAQIGVKWINFVQAAANIASESDGTYIDNSRLMSLRCCNNLLTLPGNHFQVACDAEALLGAFKSSGTSSVEGIRNEWALFVRNISAILFRTRSSGTEAHVLSCADSALDIIRSAPPTAGMAVWNAVLALGTCAHFSPEMRSHIAGKGAKVICSVLHVFVLSFQFQDALTRIVGTFASADSANTVATEALGLFK